MNLHFDGKLIRIPRPVTIEYMLKLDGHSLKNLSHSNKEFRDFCQRTDVWKRMVMKDFSNDYESMPVYLNEPDWMRVYFWFNKKNLVKARLNLCGGDQPIYRGNSIFSRSRPDVGTTKFTNLIGALLDLGATVDGHLIFINGLYLNEYQFSISHNYYENTIDLIVDMSESSKLFDQLMSDVKTLVLMTEPKNFSISQPGYSEKPYRNDIDALFEQTVPNYAYTDPYSYLYVSHLTIDKRLITREIITNYISQKLLHLEPFHIQTPAEYDVNKFLVSISNIGYDLDIGYIHHSLFGVYHGTPFLVFSHEYEKKLYVLCPTKNPDPLLAKLKSFL